MEEDKTNSQAQPAPGAVISPQSGNPPAVPEATIVSPAPIQAESVIPDNNTLPDQSLAPEAPLENAGEGISWVGPEFVSHDKPSTWYMMCIIVAVALGGGTYFATGRDLVSSATVTIAILILGFYSLRKPKNTNYNLSDRGISIGSKSISYEELRAFTASIDGNYLSVNLFPLRRFAAPAGLCYEGEDEEKIVNFLSDRLPMEQHKLDLLDNMMQRLRL